jgi:F0F1-type ATP synthase assembly protein I
VRATNDRLPVDASQRRELSQQMHRTTGGYELVLSPLLLALIGYGLDRLVGTVPVITIVFAVLGLAGAVIKLYFGYRNEMEAHEASGPWAK